MADSVEHEVSSTTPLFNEAVHHYQPEPELQAEPEPEAVPVPQPKPDIFSVDDIVDLVGGAQDALDRHRAEDIDLTEPEPATLLEPELEPEQEPVSVPEITLKEPEPEPAALPDSTSASFVPEPIPPPSPSPPPSPPVSSFPLEPEVVAPKAEPEITKLEPEPVPEPAPVPVPEPESDALPAAAAEQRPAVTEKPAAPASYVPSPSKAQPHPLMQFPTVVDLLYWRDVKTTGVVFGAALLLLLSLMVCSIVSVCSYIGLALLSVTICFRIYKGILQAIQKSDEGHPFKQYLDQEVALSEDMVHKYSDLILAKINKTIGELRRVFLVEDLVDSIKFAVLMWILTYVGALFNGLTLLILALIAAFSCPIVYEKHQVQIDHYLALVNNQVKDVVGKIQAKVPGMKRKAE